MFCTWSSWTSRKTESLSSGFLQDYLYLASSLTLPPHLPHDVRMIDAGIFPQHCCTTLNLINFATQKQGTHLLISPWLFSVQEHKRSWKGRGGGVEGVHAIANYGPWLQVLITELLIRNQKVLSPPEKDEERCQSKGWKNLPTSQRQDRAAEESNVSRSV